MITNKKPSDQSPIVIVDQLFVHFPINKGTVLAHTTGYVRAVDGVSFQIQRGETLGLVGESGSGKTTLGRAILGLYQPTSGRIEIDGQEVNFKSGRKMKEIRHKAQMIFQDPFSSLNPRWTVNSIVNEPIRVHKITKGKKEQESKVTELLGLVGLNKSYLNRFPHEFSGGQRQRIGIARALASRPIFVVCDEPIAALDVSIQAQVVNLLEDLRDQLRMTYLFIAHDLSMVRHICNRVAVMYLGMLMELAEKDELYENPLHPYTKALLSAVPIPDPIVTRERKRILLQGDIPSPMNPPQGCRFHTRCPIAKEYCSRIEPVWREINPGHWVYCHEVAPRYVPGE
jgi:oligopeptide transport system ATP-binding protein